MDAMQDPSKMQFYNIFHRHLAQEAMRNSADNQFYDMSKNYINQADNYQAPTPPMQNPGGMTGAVLREADSQYNPMLMRAIQEMTRPDNIFVRRFNQVMGR